MHALATLAAATAPKHPVSGEMLLTVAGVTFVVVSIIVMVIAKSKNWEDPVKAGIVLGGIAAGAAWWIAITAIAAHRM